MIRLLKLYSKPEIFDPITFTEGINLVLGEKVEESLSVTQKDRKTNGVGKSMCIEFINFCLLKNERDSRVMRVPVPIFPEETLIMLDIMIGSEVITIIRTKARPEQITIIRKGENIELDSTEDATSLLGDIYFSSKAGEAPIQHPTFRELLGPIIRDEDSEFKDLVHCYDLSKNIPVSNLVKTHLYFFGIEFTLVSKIREIIGKIDTIRNQMNFLFNELTEAKRIKLGDVKLNINSLGDELKKWKSSLDDLRTNDIYEAVEDELNQNENDIDSLRSKFKAYNYEANRIKSLPVPEDIDVADIEILYNQFKSGLGDLISKSFDEAIGFKNKIQEFQNKVMGDKLSSLIHEMDGIRLEIDRLEAIRSDKLKVLSNKGVLKDIKNKITVLEQKDNEFLRKKTQLDSYEQLGRDLNFHKADKEKYYVELEASIFEAQNTIKSFDSTVRMIHDYIMGTTATLFEISVNKSSKSKSEIVKIEMRIDDDGSHSVDRTKVFIYDISLLFNQITQKRHPGFLVHDNIFDVDQDTLVRSLNFLNSKEEIGGFQYILTLNRDKIENEEKNNTLELEIKKHTVADFTRKNKFLKKDYQEEN